LVKIGKPRLHVLSSLFGEYSSKYDTLVFVWGEWEFVLRFLVKNGEFGKSI